MKGEHLGELEELVLLAVQAASGDAYGVTVQQTIEQTTGRAVTLGAVYACLERLERKNFVASRVGGEEARQGGRRKRFFTLLPPGVEVLRRTRDAREALWGLTEANDGCVRTASRTAMATPSTLRRSLSRHRGRRPHRTLHAPRFHARTLACYLARLS
ncbi:MAG: hypothetical protein GKS06_19175 [Acidobacteria bacterium]|nr:hypothetical protein [Acidobacteriota bacterium]